MEPLKQMNIQKSCRLIGGSGFKKITMFGNGKPMASPRKTVVSSQSWFTQNAGSIFQNSGGNKKT